MSRAWAPGRHILVGTMRRDLWWTVDESTHDIGRLVVRYSRVSKGVTRRSEQRRGIGDTVL